MSTSTLNLLRARAITVKVNIKSTARYGKPLNRWKWVC